MIIQEFRKQQEQDNYPFVQEMVSENIEHAEQINDIALLADERQRWGSLPKAVSIGRQLSNGVKYLWSHSMHDREYLLKQGKSKWAVKKALRQCNMKEAGHALIKDRKSDLAVLPQTDFVVGKVDALGAYLTLDKALVKEQKRGEEIVGTIHTHPVFTAEYIEGIRKRYKLPDDFEPFPQLSKKQEEIYTLVNDNDSEIAPPSIPDVIAAVLYKGIHLVVAKKKIYCLVPSTSSRIIDEETAYELKHKRLENFMLNGAKKLAERENTQITASEMDVLSLHPLQELCKELRIGLYMSDWNSQEEQQQELILKRIA